MYKHGGRYGQSEYWKHWRMNSCPFPAQAAPIGKDLTTRQLPVGFLRLAHYMTVENIQVAYTDPWWY